MAAHRPSPMARRQAARIATQIAGDLETARLVAGASVELVARRARVAPSTAARVLHGDAGVHLDTLCAVARAIGMSISVKAYPGPALSLRDSGQLRAANLLIARAAPGYRPALELPVGDPFGRAADLVLFGPTEILHLEIERRLADLQAVLRSATVKREALQSRHDRPVRLVLVVEDTRRNRRLIAPHATLLRRQLPIGSRGVTRSLRDGTALGQDGLLWVRPWEGAPAGDQSPD